MSADPVNLRQFRKRAARQEKEEMAQANRVAYGRSKAEKTLTGAINMKNAKAHEQQRLDNSERGQNSDPSSRNPK